MKVGRQCSPISSESEYFVTRLAVRMKLMRVEAAFKVSCVVIPRLYSKGARDQQMTCKGQDGDARIRPCARKAALPARRPRARFLLVFAEHRSLSQFAAADVVVLCSVKTLTSHTPICERTSSTASSTA